MQKSGKKWTSENGKHNPSYSTGYMSFKTCLLLTISVATIWVVSEFFYRGLLVEATEVSLRTRVAWGFFAIIGASAVMSIHFLPNGTFKWPCYAFWKVMLGINILYFMLLVFLMFQDTESIRSALAFIDPKLQEKVPEANYAGHSCSIIGGPDGLFTNILPKIDMFVIAHFLGWMVKTLILRNDFLVWTNSILFEWLEITLRHILPNFYECWWDHLLLDIFGCNMMGIFCGNYIIRKFSLTRFNWHTSRVLPNAGNSMKPASHSSPSKTDTNSDRKNQKIMGCSYLSLIKNFIYSLFKWPETLSTLRGFASFLILTAIVQLIDLNYFFFKAELYMPISHWIFGARTILLAICGASAVRELYETFATNSSAHYGKINFQCWLIVVVIFTESLLCWRFSGNLRVQSFLPSKFIIYIWTFICFLLFALCLFLTLKSSRENSNSNSKKNI
ncbi:phosphatidylserine synthase [Cryptosporidium canis]|nr:phosphatidylserine synthase [Cryptosporidium canis]